jgi:hypothetical protein
MDLFPPFERKPFLLHTWHNLGLVHELQTSAQICRVFEDLTLLKKHFMNGSIESFIQKLHNWLFVHNGAAAQMPRPVKIKKIALLFIF